MLAVHASCDSHSVFAAAFIHFLQFFFLHLISVTFGNSYEVFHSFIHNFIPAYYIVIDIYLYNVEHVCEFSDYSLLRLFYTVCLLCRCRSVRSASEFLHRD